VGRQERLVAGDLKEVTRSHSLARCISRPLSHSTGPRSATSGLDSCRLEPIRQLKLSIAGDVDPHDIGLQQESVLYQVFPGSHQQEAGGGPTTNLQHHEWAIL
jgi:hypothetical protein